MRTFRITKSTPKSSGMRSKVLQQKKPPPRQDSPNANDVRNRTSYHPEQAHWSWTSLPEILYQLSPEEKDERSKDPGLMPYPIHGKYLRDLPVLPDNISSTVEEFRVEAWQRIDARIYLDDITDRMHPDFRIKNNALQQRGVRFRQAFNIKAWHSGNKRSAQLEAELLRRMDELGLDITANSTRGITPGLIHPKLGEAGGRVPIPKGWQARKLGSGGIKPKSTPTLLLEPEVSSEDPEVLPQASEVSEHEAQVIEHIQEFVPYDEHHNHPDGALPVIRGLIPDEELPTTVSMHELSLLGGYRQPIPEIEQGNDSIPLMLNPDRLAWRARFWSPSSALSIRGFCDLPCFEDSLQQYEELLDYNPPLVATASKPQTPTAGIFPVTELIQLNMVTEAEQKNVFDDMLLEYYKGERQLTEMPCISLAIM
ncbi:hypothetical protein BDW62DRAFT_216898 [Aspergillus aurantiobrunneus]